MQTISIELSEVQSSWLKNPSQINCRISTKSLIQVMRFRTPLTFEILSPSASDQVHVLIQEDNIVLGSLTITFEWMFGPDMKKALDDWIFIEVPIESIILITKKQASEISSKVLKLKLLGKCSEAKREESKAEKVKTFEINVEEYEEEKKVFHRKLPSEADSLEREPQGKKVKKIERARSPQPQSPLKGPALSPRSRGSKSPSPEKMEKKKIKAGDIKAKPMDLLGPSQGNQENPKSPKSKLLSPKSSHSKTKSPKASSPKPLSPKASSPRLQSPKSSLQEPPVSNFPPAETKIQPSQKIMIEEANQTKNPFEQVCKPEDNISLGSSVLSSDNEKESYEEPQRRRPEKMHLTADTVHSPCSYYCNVAKTEWHLNTIMSILSKLKEDMGASFLKLIEESTRRDSRSPTRSPSRKITNSGLRTPLVSQRSLNASVISAFRVEEENIVEVQGNVDVFLDRLSIKNVEILAICISGLLAKNTSALAQLREIEPTKEAINAHEKSKNMILDSVKATTTEFAQEQENYDILIKRIKEDISNTSQNLEAAKKKALLLAHDKQNYEKTLKKLQEDKKDILKKYNANVDLEEIKQMKKAVEQLERSRIEFEEKLMGLASQYKSVFESSASLQNKYLEEKASILTEIKSVNSTLETVERENHKIKSEVQGNSGFIYVDDELHKMLLSFQTGSRSHFSSLDSMRTQLTFLRSHKEDLATESQALQQKIEAETKRVKSSQASWNKEIESNSEIISKLREENKKIRQELAHIEEAYSKKINVESNFEAVVGKAKHNQETKDQLMSEISYFSDFVFSLSQTFLQQRRIFEKVKNIVVEKEMEVEAMRTAVYELKNSNPVYFPVPDDPIDQAVADYLNARDEVLIVPFVRETFGVYLYGSKKVMVSVERGKLIIKVGGGFLPIEVFLENYTDTELDKFDNKVLDASPKMKKFMAKWVGGINPNADSPEKMKESLVKAMESHKYSQAYGVRDIKPVVKREEILLTPPRAETPIIEEDI